VATPARVQNDSGHCAGHLVLHLHNGHAGAVSAHLADPVSEAQ